MTTDTTTQPFDTVARTLRTGAEMVAETLEADADWLPVMMFVGPNGETSINEVAEGFASDDVKAHFFANLPDIIWKLDAQIAGIVLSSWAVTHGPQADGTLPDPDDRPRPRDAVDRVELLAITVAAHGRVESWNAPILRRDDAAPTLGAWEPFVHPDGEYCGDLVEALRRAFT